MAPSVTPLDRRPGDLPVPGMIAGTAPVVLAFVSLAAWHTHLIDGSIGGWAYLYVVPMILLGAAAALLLGARLLPRWVVLGYPAAMIGGAALLELSEALAPLTLAAALAMGARALRAPLPPAAPGVVAVAPSAAVGPGWEVPERRAAAGSALGAPTGAPAVAIPVVTRRFAGALVVVALLCVALGAYLVAAGSTDEIVVEGGSAARWIALAFGVFLLGLGWLFGRTAWRTRNDTLLVDARGMERRGGLIEWTLPWADITAVGVGLTVRVVPDDLTPTPRRVRERRTVQLLFTPVGAGARAATVERLGATDLPAPFTHVQPLPDTTPWAERPELADVLARALEAQVPDRYLELQDA